MNPWRLITICLLLAASPAQAGVISPRLDDLMADLDDQDLIKVLVVLDEQAPIAEMDRQMHLNKATLAVRHKAVVSTLQETAFTSQKDLLSALEIEKARGGVEGYTSHWIINAIVVKGTVEAIRNLANQPQVGAIEPDLVTELIEPVMQKPAQLPPEKTRNGFVSPGVLTIGADRVWHELGIDGTGTLVANMDSGVDVNHPALGPRWRGNTAPAGSAWRDFGDVGSPTVPFDVVGHGTHVMGTITGSTAFDTVGVAPGAEWIATNAIASSIENFDNAIIAGFEWMADPDGNPDTTDDVPDVMHNSWGVVQDYGYPPCYSGWWSVIDNCEAAGVVVTFSAGNEGPAPGTLRSPGDRATTATNCFTVGSTATNFPNAVSSFSSRGPSLCGGEWSIKPEVMGPGEDIISCFPGGGYTYMSGTSMAGPHIAGVVALMRQAAPNLDVTTIKEVLMATAIDLGTAGEDNNYGHGMVDAYAAVAMVLDNVGTVQGTITDEITGLPLVGVRIQDTRGQGQTTSDEDGQYQFTIFSGPATLEFSQWGYLDASITLEIPAGGALDQDVILTPMPLASVSGTVWGPGGGAVEGATISVLDNPVDPVVSGPDGSYNLSLPSGSDVNYELLAVAPNLAYELQYVGHPGHQTLDFHLPVPQADGFESGGFDTFDWQTGGAQPWAVGGNQAFEGALSAQTGAIDHSTSSELAIDFYVHGDGLFGFHYKVDTEISYDIVKFYIDDVLQETWSGNIEWTRYTTSLTTGWHNLRWVYTKDSEVSVGQDAAWIDLVEFPGTGVQPLASITLSPDQLSHTLDAGTAGSVVFEIGNDGGYPLDFAIQPAVPWAQVHPATGLVYPGNWATITVNLSGSSATAGVNQTDLAINSNDPDQPETAVEVTLTVNPVSAVNELPRQLNLTGAVPNPFNPSTAIKFGLPDETRVNLTVYDVSGRPVRHLLNQTLPGGHHTQRWDGKNDSGHNVASGVYFARLKTTEDTRIKSMVLVR